MFLLEFAIVQVCQTGQRPYTAVGLYRQFLYDCEPLRRRGHQDRTLFHPVE